MYWFEQYYPNFILNWYDVPLFIRYMNGIEGGNHPGKHLIWIIDKVVTIAKYKKITIYHAIYIKVFYGGTLSCLTVSTDGYLNTTNNETWFPELWRVSEEVFEIKFQEGFVLKYLVFRIFQSPIRFSIYQTNHIMELVNEWFPTGNICKVYTPFLDRLHIWKGTHYCTSINIKWPR